jgi:hypothetical protein
MMNWRSLAAALFGLVLSLGVSPAARAEGGAGPEAMSMGNMCMVMFGYDMIHITVFQPDKSRSEYCSEIPSTGRAIMAFDLETPSFRDLPLELRIIRDPLTPSLPTGAELDAITELHIPAKKYTKGTFSVEHEFTTNGHYIGIVTLTRDNGEKQTESWKFSVGETLWAWVPQIAGTILIAGMVFAYWKHTHPTPKKKENAETAAS